MTYGEFKKIAETDPIAEFLIGLWKSGKAPLCPVMDLYIATKKEVLNKLINTLALLR